VTAGWSATKTQSDKRLQVGQPLRHNMTSDCRLVSH